MKKKELKREIECLELKIDRQKDQLRNYEYLYDDLLGKYIKLETKYDQLTRPVKPISDIECICGNRINKSFNYCPRCGKKLDFSGYNEMRLNDAIGAVNKANEFLTGGVGYDNDACDIL